MGFRIRSGLPMVLVVALAAAFPPASQAAFPGENGKLAFVGDYPYEIFTVNLDGGDLTQITPINAGDRDPAWSPDGQKIAFTRGYEFGADIYTMNADGSDVRRLTDDLTADGSPAWSPDGRKIAFARANEPSRHCGGIFVMNSDGSDPTLLTCGSYNTLAFAPEWSPDGKKIALIAADDYPHAYYALEVINVDGRGIRRLGSGGGEAYAATWSPDSGRLAVGWTTRYIDWPVGISVVNADGSGWVSLLPPDNINGVQGTGDRWPAWAPDGRKIAFYSTTGDGSDEWGGSVQDLGLYTMNPDGTGRAKFLERAGSQLDWQSVPNDPRRFKNAPAFCTAQRGALGESAFTNRYGEFGKCVSRAAR